jgi:hypothetical protein
VLYIINSWLIYIIFIMRIFYSLCFIEVGGIDCYITSYYN